MKLKQQSLLQCATALTITNPKKIKTIKNTFTNGVWIDKHVILLTDQNLNLLTAQLSTLGCTIAGTLHFNKTKINDVTLIHTDVILVD